jgi:hypothetical protein
MWWALPGVTILLLSVRQELKHLRQAVLLAFVVAPTTVAQNDPELTKQTSEHYRTLQSFEFGGRLTAVIPGTKLVFHVKTVNAAAGPSFVSVKNKVSKLVQMGSFRESEITDEEGRKPKTPIEPAPITMPSRFGEYEKLSDGIRTAKELPHEVLKVDRSPVDCSVLEVEYERPEWKPEEQTVKYWIDAKRLIVLKQEFSEFQRHDKKTALWHWVYQVDSVKLNQPPPEWFTELLKKRADAGHDRPDWIGRDAPPFSLLDLNGRQVTLAAMRGRVFVLDFFPFSPKIHRWGLAAMAKYVVTTSGIRRNNRCVRRLKLRCEDRQTELRPLLEPPDDSQVPISYQAQATLCDMLSVSFEQIARVDD